MAIAITGVFVWEGGAEPLSREPRTIRIEGAHITGVGAEPALARDAEVFHYEGATALPGLIDAHVHLSVDPALGPADQDSIPQAEREPAMRARAVSMLRAGITTARDLGGGEWSELALRDAIAVGETPGPRLLCAGQPLTTPGGHCHFWGGEVHADDQIAAVIARQIEHGADWIKVMATGGVNTRGTKVTDLQFGAAQLERIVADAGAHGRRVAAHCHGSAGIGCAADAGVHTIEHCSFAGDDGFGSDFDPAVLSRIAARGAWVSPTVNVGWGYRALAKRKDDEPEDSPRVPSAFFERMSRVLRALRSAGVPFVASTDAGIPGVKHDRLAAGLAALAHFAAMTPAEVLRAATSDAALALGIGDRTGALRRGLEADILVVQGDPLRDLALLERPRAVFARGVPVDLLAPT